MHICLYILSFGSSAGVLFVCLFWISNSFGQFCLWQLHLYCLPHGIQIQKREEKKHMKSNKELVYFVGKDKNDVNGEHCSLNILNI